jgi:hypothetical protein
MASVIILAVLLFIFLVAFPIELTWEYRLRKKYWPLMPDDQKFYMLTYGQGPFVEQRKFNHWKRKVNRMQIRAGRAELNRQLKEKRGNPVS